MEMGTMQEDRNKKVFSGAFQPGMVDFNHPPSSLNFGKPAYVAATFRACVATRLDGRCILRGGRTRDG